jgi:hypothetical protein
MPITSLEWAEQIDQMFDEDEDDDDDDDGIPEFLTILLVLIREFGDRPLPTFLSHHVWRRWVEQRVGIRHLQFADRYWQAYLVLRRRK